FFFFFLQAEDGIRDRNVTGVQTCALPILDQNFESFIVYYFYKSRFPQSSPNLTTEGFVICIFHIFTNKSVMMIIILYCLTFLECHNHTFHVWEYHSLLRQ